MAQFACMLFADMYGPISLNSFGYLFSHSLPPKSYREAICCDLQVIIFVRWSH